VEPPSTTLYRFRPTSALLDRFQELEKQEIYFAPPEELNDPLEGFKDLFWKGDEILWPNLLKHYLLCLLYEVMTARLNAPDDPPKEEPCFVRATEGALPTKEIKALYRRALEIFNKHGDVHGFVASLSRRINPIKREELTTYLGTLHYHALNSVLSAMEEAPGLLQRPANDLLRDASSQPLFCCQMSEHLERAEEERGDAAKLAEGLAAAEGNIRIQQFLLAQYRSPDLFINNKAWQAVLVEYPARYVRQLEQLLYSEWYTACFVGDPTQAAMWGNYGDGHKGVCLRFKTPLDASGRPTITLRQQTGIRSGKVGPEPIFGEVAHPLYKIEYRPKFVEIDFFRSLGTLNRPMLNFWLTAESGELSTRVADIFAESDEWRRQYWANSVTAITTKLCDWAHEGEYRATLGGLNDFSNSASRKLRYRFSDLDGIIFGVKTSTADKLRIMDIIAKKCKQEGRISFQFLQAQFINATGKFAILPLDLLRAICVDPSTPQIGT
jgi:hypothetical protein